MQRMPLTCADFVLSCMDTLEEGGFSAPSCSSLGLLLWALVLLFLVVIFAWGMLLNMSTQCSYCYTFN